MANNEFIVADLCTEKSKQLRELFHKLKYQHSWNNDDARLTVIAKTVSSLDSARLAIYLVRKKNIRKPTKLNNRKIYQDANLDPSYADYLYKIHINGVKRSIILNLHQSLESSIRVICESNNCPYTGLKNMYNWLIDSTTLAQDEKDELKEVIHIIRALRNTVHNNGIYKDITGTENPFIGKFRDINISLYEGQQAPLTWSIMNDLIAGTAMFLIQILQDVNITNFNVSSDPSHEEI